MLLTLELRDFAIVDELALELGPGLNVLSGETGAGKSIVVDALSLLVGARAEVGLIRSGAESALVQGLFEEASLARRLQASGRHSARLNGELVTVGELASLGSSLVAIHGQHAFQTLLDGGEQRRLLDQQLSPASRALLDDYRKRYTRYQEVARRLEALRQSERERAQRLDMLRFQQSEIGAAKLTPGEDEILEREAEGLRHAERTLQAAAKALAHLSEAEVNALGLLSEARRELELAGRHHKTLAVLAGELAEALGSVQAISQEVEGFVADYEADPEKLERIEARLALIGRLKRKYGDSVDAILRHCAEVEAELATLEQAEGDIAELTSQQAELLAALQDAAAELTAARRQAADKLTREVSAHLPALGMEGARFAVVLEPSGQLGPEGQDKVTYLFSANVGEPLAPLSQVASGGELSRVMLAMNVVTGSQQPILVFDEVDAGIGGKTARQVGRLLKQLACEHQVLVVTHLAQVAAFADRHYLVEKLEQHGRTVTRVRLLEGEARERELARMLSGATTKTALAHARELLATLD
jgi:DNA repair protein RecN (Recombination protein N)